VLLATRSLGEADLLVVLLTPGVGKVRAAARHARNSRKRFPGGLVGGAVGEATLELRRSSLSRLTSFSPIRDHSGLGRNLTRFAYVAYLCEITDALLHEPEPDPELFSALCDAIRRTMDARPRAVVLRRYELQLLRSQGLLPALDSCAVCGDPLAPGPSLPFDDTRGGALCSTHGRGAERRSASVVEAATLLLAGTEEAEIVEALDRVEALGAGQRRELRDRGLAWLRAHLRRPLRSREFFAKLGPRAGPTDDS